MRTLWGRTAPSFALAAARVRRGMHDNTVAARVQVSLHVAARRCRGHVPGKITSTTGFLGRGPAAGSGTSLAAQGREAIFIFDDEVRVQPLSRSSGLVQHQSRRHAVGASGAMMRGKAGAIGGGRCRHCEVRSRGVPSSLAAGAQQGAGLLGVAGGARAHLLPRPLGSAAVLLHLQCRAPCCLLPRHSDSRFRAQCVATPLACSQPSNHTSEAAVASAWHLGAR